MRLLHTSDLHLGLTLCGRSLCAEQRMMLDGLCRIAAENSVSALLICGDVFDRAVPPPDAVKLWSDFTAELCGELGISAYVIAGNHDGGVRLGSCSELLRRGGLTVAGTPTVPGIPEVIGDAAIHMLSYFTPEDVRTLIDDQTLSSWRDAGKAMADAAAKMIIPGKYNILMTHCYVNGAELSDSERSLVSGGVTAFDSTIFDAFDYTAAGHLHRRQKLGSVRYSGSPLCYSFGEAGQKKTVTLIDTDSREITDLEIPQPYSLVTYSGSFDEVMGMAKKDSAEENLFVRAEITSGYNGYTSLELLREAFPNLLTVTLKQSGSDLGDIVTTYRGEDMTPSELLRSYAADTGLEFDDELEEWFGEVSERVSKRLNETEVNEA